jgi:hypothetical protein
MAFYVDRDVKLTKSKAVVVDSRKHLINGRNGTQWTPGTRTHNPSVGDSSPAGGSRTHRK